MEPETINKRPFEDHTPNTLRKKTKLSATILLFPNAGSDKEDIQRSITRINSKFTYVYNLMESGVETIVMDRISLKLFDQIVAYVDHGNITIVTSMQTMSLLEWISFEQAMHFYDIDDLKTYCRTISEHSLFMTCDITGCSQNKYHPGVADMILSGRWKLGNDDITSVRIGGKDVMFKVSEMVPYKYNTLN